MPEASIASITSPEHGAQQECSSTFFAPFGGTSVGRTMSVTSGVVMPQVLAQACENR
jgi:hypothetical protein